MPLRRIALLSATIVALCAVPATAAPPAGYTALTSGPLTGGGTWDFSIKRTSISGVKGVCLDLTPTAADGSSTGGGGGCLAGSLRAAKGIGNVGIHSEVGGAVKANLVGGLVYAKARRVKVTFEDGKVLRLKTHRPPEGWRRLLKSGVRFFAGDALAVTPAKVTKIAIFDRKGHRISRRSL
jgi:hypothetical protein